MTETKTLQPLSHLYRGLHHVAIIAKDYEQSKRFYVDLLGLWPVRETYRAERNSFKLDLSLHPPTPSSHSTLFRPTPTQIELFSFPNPPPRPSRPEAAGARHICLAVNDLDEAMQTLLQRQHHIGIGNLLSFEEVRIDELTGERFVFFADPDGLPIELKQVGQNPEWS